MRNVAPSRSLVRRANQVKTLALLVGAVGIFVTAIGVFLAAIPLVYRHLSVLWSLRRSIYNLALVVGDRAADRGARAGDSRLHLEDRQRPRHDHRALSGAVSRRPLRADPQRQQAADRLRRCRAGRSAGDAGLSHPRQRRAISPTRAPTGCASSRTARPSPPGSTRRAKRLPTSARCANSSKSITSSTRRSTASSSSSRTSRAFA